MSETVEELEQIIHYLTTSRTVWRTVIPTTNRFFSSRPATYDNNWPLVTSTFFYGVRASTAPRLYMWGDIGNLQTYKKQPMYTGAATSLGSNFTIVAAASAAAYQQVFPPNSSSVSNHPGICAPNTEEFLSRGAVHNPLPDVVSIDAVDNAVVMACDASGKLYVRGDVDAGLDNECVDSPLNPAYNQLGLGPRRPKECDVMPFINIPPRFNSPCRQYALQRVYGDDPSFGSVKFVKVQSFRSLCAALDDEGYIWFAGDATSVSSSDEYPADPSSSRQFSYYRKQVVTQWIDIHGVLQSGELTFSDMWLDGGSGYTLLALTKDGRLFVVGTATGWGVAAAVTTRYRQIGGFIDTIAPVGGGPTISTSAVTITIAAPPAGGTRAQAQPIMQNVGPGQWTLFGVRLNNPGSGYTSPPAVTVTYSGISRTDLVTCTVFDSTWKSAHVKGSRYAGISSAGVLYLWGPNAYNNVITKAEYGTVTNTLDRNDRDFLAPIRAVQFQQAGQPVPQQLGEYDKVRVISVQFAGFALSASGQLTYWGLANRTPNGTLTRELTAWPNGTYIDCDVSDITGDVVFGLIDSNNDAYTYGTLSAALGHGSEVSASLGIAGYRSITKVVGSAKWLRLFGMKGNLLGFYAVRLPEQLDEFGVRKNPLPPFGS